MEIPKRKSYIELIIKYADEKVNQKYIVNEEKLRKVIGLEKENESIKDYNIILDKFEENIKVEMEKIELIKSIYNQNNEEIKKMIFA